MLAACISNITADGPEWIERAETACKRALELDPQLPDALVAQARICFAQEKTR